jgi:hypothetical protein
MLIRRGSSTNVAYITSAGTTNNQPMRFSRETSLLRVLRREEATAPG